MKLPIDRRAYPFAWIFISLVIIFWFVWKPLCFFVAFILVLHVAFFRDPKRIPPAGDALVAPADGKVVEVTEVFDERYLKETAVRIRIFLSLFVPHINRSPADGKVEFISYKPGQFINALDPECFARNESNWVGIRHPKGCILVRQLAGMIARRIYCDVKVGETLKRGQKFGIICYSSGAEIYIPKRLFKPQVQVGARVKAGETVLGEWIV